VIAAAQLMVVLDATIVIAVLAIRRPPTVAVSDALAGAA
jgi:hypothetical protein